MHNIRNVKPITYVPLPFPSVINVYFFNNFLSGDDINKIRRSAVADPEKLWRTRSIPYVFEDKIGMSFVTFKVAPHFGYFLKVNEVVKVPD